MIVKSGHYISEIFYLLGQCVRQLPPELLQPNLDRFLSRKVFRQTEDRAAEGHFTAHYILHNFADL